MGSPIPETMGSFDWNWKYMNKIDVWRKVVAFLLRDLACFVPRLCWVLCMCKQTKNKLSEMGCFPWHRLSSRKHQCFPCHFVPWGSKSISPRGCQLQTHGREGQLWCWRALCPQHCGAFHRVPLCAPVFAVITKLLSDETVGVIRDLHI